MLLAAAGALLVAASSAGATSTTIGGVNTAPGDLDFDNACSGCRLFQAQTGAGSPSYTVPPGSWAVTSWSTAAGAAPYGEGSPHVLFIEHDPGSNYTLRVDRTSPAPLAESQVNTFNVNIHVEGGWLLGIETGAQPAARSPNTPSDQVCNYYGTAVCESTGLVNVEATL